jgi:hydrogenase 3 maturation protease
LKEWLENAEKIVVVGIGNELRKDDFVGVQIVKELEGRVSNKVMLIESETVPEAYMDSIIKFHPTHVLLIDAGLLGLKPGNMKFIKASNFPKSTSTPISTHALPLQIFCEYIQQSTNAELALIIIEPKDTAFGEGLSVEIKKTTTKLVENLLSLLN